MTSQVVAAATVVLVRDAPDGDGTETLMLHRASKIAFGGMWVFPGGRVEADDADPAAPGDEIAAARRAAARECIEETGLAVAADDLAVLSHWMPPAGAPRRFSTWFFVAAAPPGAVVVDGGEIRDHRWMRPSDALDQRDEGTIELAPPTWVTLHELAGAGSAAEVVDRVRALGEPQRFATRIGDLDGTLVTMWHGDAGYEDSDPTRDGPRHRLSMGADGWRYERTPL